MTKIRDMATIRHLRKVPPMNVTKTRKLPEKLQQRIEQRQRDARAFRDVVLMTIEDIGHPASAIEIRAHLNASLSKDYNLERVRYALNSLVETGKVFSRTETDEERALRFVEGSSPMARNAALYFNSNPVPARTEPAIAGTQLTGPTKKRGRRKAQPAAATGESAITTLQRLHTTAEAIDFLVEKLVAERTRDLQAQLDEANLKLSKLRNLLS